MKSPNTNQRGALALIVILGIAFMSLILVTSLGAVSSSGLKLSTTGNAAEKTFVAAEAGLNDALYKLSQNPDPGDYTLSVPGFTNPVQVAITPGIVSPKTITSTATDAASGVVRTVELQVSLSSFFGFSGAVLAGNGGFYLGNSSAVIGDVCANGDVEGKNSNAHTITGDLTVGGVHTAKEVNVIGDLRADSILAKSKVSGDAYYFSAISPQTSVTGSTTHLSAAPENCLYPPIPAYLTDKPGDSRSHYQKALLGGTTIGDVVVPANATISLGPRVIRGNIILNNSSHIILTGSVWVEKDPGNPGNTGKILFTNPNGRVDLDPGVYGDLSGAIISENIIDLKNNGNFAGATGHPKSFLLVSSLENTDTPPAIDAANNNDTAIFYAPLGTVHLSNNLSLSNATGEKIFLENATIKYDDKLRDLILSGSTTLFITPKIGTWGEK